MTTGRKKEFGALRWAGGTQCRSAEGEDGHSSSQVSQHTRARKPAVLAFIHRTRWDFSADRSANAPRRRTRGTAQIRAGQDSSRPANGFLLSNATSSFAPGATYMTCQVRRVLHLSLPCLSTPVSSRSLVLLPPPRGPPARRHGQRAGEDCWLWRRSSYMPCLTCGVKHPK